MSISYRVRCPPGLELILETELKRILPHTTFVPKRGIGSLDFSSFDAAPTLTLNPVDKTLASIAQNSRVATGLLFQLGPQFKCEWENQLVDRLRSVSWNYCYKKGGQLPKISVKSSRSRLFEPGYVKRLVSECLQEFNGTTGEQMRSIPDLSVIVEDDIMRIYIDAGGVNMNRLKLDPFEATSRLNISEQIAAGCVIRSFNSVLDRLTSPGTVWDPFSGSGVFPLTVAKTIAGVPAGSPGVPYPFRTYPSHDTQTFEAVADELRLSPHVNAKNIERILLSDSSMEAIGISTRNLQTFSESLPTIGNESSIPFPISIERKPDAYVPPETDSLAIVTALPAGGDSARKCVKFHSMLEDVHSRLVGCVVFTSKPLKFKRLSKRQWLTELRVFDGRRFIEALRLVS